MLDLDAIEEEFAAAQKFIDREKRSLRATPQYAARIAACFTGLPVVVTICDEDPSGAYRQSSMGPWIEARGRENDIMLAFTIWHEVGHHKSGVAKTSLPYIWQEFAADFYACEFFERFLPEHFDHVIREAKGRMSKICAAWHDLNLIVHPVPDSIANWCGWENPGPVALTAGGG